MSMKGSITTSDYLPFTEYQRLVKNLEDEGEYRWAAYCLLSFCLALRVSDILKLKWEDVYHAQTTKVVLYDKMGRPAMSNYIVTNKHGNPVSRQYLNVIVKLWKKKYSLELGNFSTHTFRKTFGRYVYEKMGRSQESLVYLNHIFRHTSIQTTMIYIGIRDDEVGGIFNSIEV